MTAFYNEIDPFAAQWLRNLIAAGHIASGVVDERPIQEIEAWELAGYTQCHFFAGIGVWSIALRRVGWPDDRPIWTGSCPCQPFSSAGKQKGFNDERHLWPTWFKLIAECRPPTVIGEQVASKDGLGWFDLVSTDLEASDYAVAAADLCAAGFGQAHLRQRLYFVGLADADCREWSRIANTGEFVGDGQTRGWEQSNGSTADDRATSGLVNADCASEDERAPSGEQSLCLVGNESGMSDGLAHHHHPRLEGRAGMSECGNQCTLGAGSMVGRLANTPPEFRDRTGDAGTARRSEYSDSSSTDTNPAIRDPREIDQRWLDADWLLCRNPAGEPSWRPVEPGTFPLAHGVAARMDCLRAYGNALDAETATVFAEIIREIVGV